MTELVVNVRRWGFDSLRLLAKSFAAHWLIITIPALCVITNMILFADLPHKDLQPVFDVLMEIATSMIPVGIAVAVVVRFVQYAFIIKPESPARALVTDIRNFITKPAALINGLPIVVAITLYNKAFLDLKPQIPYLNPFKWDEYFMQLDRTLHFGIDPWRLLQPLMGYDYVTFASCLLYNMWFIALFGTMVWFAFQKNSSELRTRFFVSYMLIWWIGGGLMAVYFSSAGPAYYSRIGLTPDPYSDLMAYLQDVNTRLPIWSLPTQDMLWDGYIGKSEPLGISAFPSMHNANAILFALTFRHINKFLGWFFTAYAVVILLTSVHLAWHYAVDGYAAVLISSTCWWLCGHLARWIHRQPTMLQHNQDMAALAS
ncbi:MAG: phosphatase PAP2 family protein [Alphaproteobacteria bacterium]|nr:phosphatase PAP2 family protein [Alphaproteobacteria bacterium]